MDLKLQLNDDNVPDLIFENNDIATDSGLRTAILISLFTDARASSDELSALETDPRGWWGDSFSDFESDAIGSRLWLLEREKNTAEVLRRAEEYALQALQWLVADGIADTVTAAAESPAQDRLYLDIGVKRKSGDQVNQKFAFVWSSSNGVQ